MSDTYDRLPPDQRAVLSLVLERGKSYAEVAAMLSIPETTVRERAHAALDSLATEGVVLHGPAAGSPPTRPGPSKSFPSRSAGASPRAPSSRASGALLLAGILVVIVVAIVLIAGGGGGKGAGTTTNTTTANGATSTSSNSARPRIDKKLALSPVEPESQASGEAYVLSDGSRHAFYVAARHLPPSHGFFYAVWLYNSPSSSAPLGRAPAVGSSGRLEGGGPLPSNAADYGKVIVTRETSTHARHPGTIVLSGDFSLR